MKKEGQEFLMKDNEIECPYCGERTKISKLIKDGQFDESSFEQDSDPYDYNPFDATSTYSDRISMTYNSHCPNCGKYIQIVLANRVFGYDVFDDEMNIVDSKDTELVG